MTKRQQFKKYVTRKATPAEESEVGFYLGDEEYVCLPEVQGAVILEFIEASENGATGAASKMLPFFAEVMDEDTHARFAKQIKSKDEITDIEVLSDILGDLIAQYSDRPTKASESQDAGS